jgi:hypothetical protein
MPTHSSSIDLDHSGINFGFASRLGMNSELRNVARSMKGRNAGRNPGLKGVLIYKNFGACVRARRFFESLACDWEKSLEEQIWKFDALGIREVRNAAASVARKADVMAGSVSAQQELPGTIRAWFDMWLWLLENENPGLVALFNSPATPNLVSKIDRLNKSQFWEPQNCRKFFAHRRLRKFLLEFWYPCENLTLSQVARESCRYFVRLH